MIREAPTHGRPTLIPCSFPWATSSLDSNNVERDVYPFIWGPLQPCVMLTALHTSLAVTASADVVEDEAERLKRLSALTRSFPANTNTAVKMPFCLCLYMFILWSGLTAFRHSHSLYGFFIIPLSHLQAISISLVHSCRLYWRRNCPGPLLLFEFLGDRLFTDVESICKTISFWLLSNII